MELYELIIFKVVLMQLVPVRVIMMQMLLPAGYIHKVGIMAQKKSIICGVRVSIHMFVTCSKNMGLMARFFWSKFEIEVYNE